MKVLQRVFDFYLDASIHVAFAIFALVRVTCLNLNIAVDGHLQWFLFFGSIACYNFVKYGVEAEKYILVTDVHHRHIQWFSFLCLAFAGYHAYFLNVNVYMAVACLTALTGLYAIPVLPHAKNLRSLGGMKIFVVALVWAGATVLLPVIAANKSISWDIRIETLQRFLFVLILILPFEVRDLAYDSTDLKTLPQRLGVMGTRILGACTTLPFFLLIFLKDAIGPAELVVYGILSIILWIVMGLTNRKQNSYFSAFWVESVPILWWGLLVLFGIML